MKKRVLILSNHPDYTYNFRKEIIYSLIDNGYEIIISSPYGNKINFLIDYGCIFEDINFNRHGSNPFKEFKHILHYRKLIKKYKPDVVLSYTIKPNIYGGIVSRIYRVPFIPNITGLGNALNSKNILNKIILKLYDIAMKKSAHVFFQNNENKRIVEKISNFSSSSVLPGSGVNLEEFEFKTYPKEREYINILYIGRLMTAKGINELLESTRILSKEKIKFQFVGFFDEPDIKDKFECYRNKFNIEYYGHQDDIKSFIQDANAVILPSYHEGMSNALLESASIGRPLLASNIPGCKEIIDEGVNGYLFEPKNSDSIYSVIKKFVSLSYEERKEMGRQSRLKVEREFDRNIVVNEYLTNIKEILEG